MRCLCFGTTFLSAFRYHRSNICLSCFRAGSQHPPRTVYQSYGPKETGIAINSQQASPQASLVRRHLLSSLALMGLLSSGPIAWAQAQLDAPQPVQAAKDLIAGELSHTLICALSGQYNSSMMLSSRTSCIQGALQMALRNTRQAQSK